MTWDAKKGFLNLLHEPHPRARPAAGEELGHRIPWILLGDLLNGILSGRVPVGLAASLIKLQPGAGEEAVPEFEAALASLHAAGDLGRHERALFPVPPSRRILSSEQAVAAVERIEHALFTLPCNAIRGPGGRADAPSVPWADRHGPKPHQAMDFLPDDVAADGSHRNGPFGDVQRCRERLMTTLHVVKLLADDSLAGVAVLSRAVDDVERACAKLADAWTDPHGMALPLSAPAAASPRSFVEEHPNGERGAVCRRWDEHLGAARAEHHAAAGFAERVEASIALNRLVQRRAVTTGLPVFHAPQTAPAAVPGLASDPAQPPAPQLALARPHAVSRYGWVPDFPDKRDRRLMAPAPALTTLAAAVDLRPHCPPVYEQLGIGSCTGNVIAAAIQIERIKAGLGTAFMPSRLFIYYNERVIENTVQSDAGAQMRDGLKSVTTTGVCSEADWPYVTDRFADAPPKQAYLDAAKTKLSGYFAVPQDLAQLKACLSDRHPILFGFSVYSSFESAQVARTGIVPMPNLDDETMLGGHAVLAVGYQDSPEVDGQPMGHFIVRNSWGVHWGEQGYFRLPYAYMLDRSLASNFWRIAPLQTGGPDRPVAAAGPPVAGPHTAGESTRPGPARRAGPPARRHRPPDGA